MADEEGLSMERLGSRIFDKLNAGGVRQSSLTLIQTALGAGFLTLSYAMSLCGLGLGMMMLAFDGLVVYFGIEIMLRGAIQFQAPDTATLLSKCVGRWSSPALDLMLVCYGNGAVAAYFILCGDFIPGILNDMVELSWISPIQLSKNELRSRCILSTLIVVIPMSIPTSLSALRYATPAALIAVLSTAVMILCHCPESFAAHLEAPGYGDINWWTLDLNFFKAFSILIFAYNCHLNIVPVASELQRTASHHIARISGGVVLLLVFFYGSIGAGGYLSFFKQTHQNVLTNYGLSAAVTACRVMLCCSIIVAIPTNLTPTVRSAQGFIKVFSPRTKNSMDNLELSLLPDDGAEATNTGFSTHGVYTLSLKAIFMCFQVCLALTVHNLADVMGFLGASVGTVLMMGIPLAVLHTAKFEDYSAFKFRLASGVLGGCMILSFSAFIVLILQKCGVLPE